MARISLHNVSKSFGGDHGLRAVNDFCLEIEDGELIVFVGPSGCRKSTTLRLTAGLAVWLLWGFFKSMPFDLEEAAMVDGCSQFEAFIKVVLPLSAPGLITVAIFSFLLSWADYVFALILIMSDQRKTLPVALESLRGARDLRWGEVLAGASLIALPLFVIFIFCYRHFIAGCSEGMIPPS